MTSGEEAKLAEAAALNRHRLSKEQLDLLLETFDSNPDPSPEETSVLAEKLKLMTGQVQRWWFWKDRLDFQKKVEALALELESLKQGIVPPELQRRIQEYQELGLLQDKLKPLDQENEQGTGSSNISGLSKEQLDLLETFASNPDPSEEETSALAELSMGQVQPWFRKKRLDLRKKMEALALQVRCLLQGIVTPALRRLILQDGEMRLLLAEIKALRQDLEQLTELRQRYSETENIVGAVQLGPPPTPGPDCDTGTPSYRMRKRASENSCDEQGEKNARMG